MNLAHGRRAARKSPHAVQRVARRRARKIKAILAGGLVLGIGSAATLAAWTDNESTAGSFTAGRFAIQTSVNKTDWDTAAQMSFNASNMYPGAVVYAPVYVRTTGVSTYKAIITVSSEAISNPNELATNLNYKAVVQTIAVDALGSYTCNANTFSGATFVYGGASSQVALAEANTSKETSEAAEQGGNVLAYCFQVTLAANTPTAAQGQSATKTWTFTGQSQSTPNTP